MRIQCESCRIEHDLDPPAWVVSSGRPFRFRCSSCGHSQMVSAPQKAAPTVSEATQPTAPDHGPAVPTSSPPFLDAPNAAPVMAATAPSAVVEVETPPAEQNGAPVYLKQDGKVYLVRDWATVQRWIMERRVEREDLVSEGGVRWEPIGTRPELGSFFAAVEQLDATVGENRAPVNDSSPSPASSFSAAPPPPFATGPSPFPFGEDENTASRFARLDDDTEGVPMGLPPLPTDEVGGPDDRADDDSGPAVKRSHLAAPTLAPSEDSAPEPVIPPPALANTPAPTMREHRSPVPQAPSHPALNAPVIAPAPSVVRAVPRIEPSMPLTGPNAPTIPAQPSPVFEMGASPAPEAGRSHTPVYVSDDDDDIRDPFKGYSTEPSTDEVPVTSGVPRWALPVALVATGLVAVALIVVVVVVAATNATGPAAAQPPEDDGAGLGTVIHDPPPVTPPPGTPEGTTPGTAPTTPEATTPGTPEGTAPETAPGAPEVATTTPEPVTSPATLADPPTLTDPTATTAPATTNPPASTSTPPSTPKPPSTAALVDKGWSSVDKGNLDAAKASFEKAVGQAPKNADAHYGLGYVQLKLGNKDSAVTHLCAALDSAGPSSDVGRDVNGLLNGNDLTCN